MDAQDEAVADVNVDPPSEVTQPLADVDMGPRRGVERPGNVGLDDSAIARRAAARLLGAGEVDPVLQPQHHRQVRKGWNFRDVKECSSARARFQRLWLHTLLANHMTTTLDTMWPTIFNPASETE